MFHTKLSELVEDLGRLEGPALDELIIEALLRGRNGLAALADRLTEPGAAGERVEAAVRRQAPRVVETVAALPEKLRDAPAADLVLAACGAAAVTDRGRAHVAAGKGETAFYLTEKAVALFPEFGPATWLSAHLAAARGDRREALRLARQAAQEGQVRRCSEGGGAVLLDDLVFLAGLELEMGTSLEAEEAVGRLLAVTPIQQMDRVASLLGEMLYASLTEGRGAAVEGAASAVEASGPDWEERTGEGLVAAARRAAEREVESLAAALIPYRQVADYLAEVNGQVLDDLVPEESLAQALAAPAEASHRALLLLAKALRSYDAPAPFQPFQVRLRLLEALAAARGPNSTFVELEGDGRPPGGDHDDHGVSPAAWGDAQRAAAGLELLLHWAAGERTVPVRSAEKDDEPQGQVEVGAAVAGDGLSVQVHLVAGGGGDDLLWRALVRTLAGAGGRVERTGARTVVVSFKPGARAGGAVGMGAEVGPSSGPVSPATAWLSSVREKAFQTYDQTLGDLTKVLAHALHDIKNNFVFLRDWAEELAAGKAPRTRVHRRLAEHIGRLQRWTESVDGYLALSQPPVPAPVAPEDLLNEIKRTFEPIMAARGTTLEVGPAQRLPPVMADRERVLSALANLVKNADEVVGTEGGAVRLDVSYDRATGQVCFQVTDSGPGLGGREKQTEGPSGDETVFGAPGMGLGLISARRIAEEHGGKLTAENAAGAAGGAVFRFCLPAHDPERELHLTVPGFDRLPAPSRQAARTAEALMAAAGESLGAGRASRAGATDATVQLSSAAYLYLKAVEVAVAETLRPAFRQHAVLPNLLKLFDHRRGKLTPVGTEALGQVARITGMEAGPGLVRKVETVLKHLADGDVARATADNLGMALALGLFGRGYRAGGQELAPVAGRGGPGVAEGLAAALVRLSRLAPLAAENQSPELATREKVGELRREALAILKQTAALKAD